MRAPTASPSPQPRSFLRRQFLPSWDERKRMFVPQAWIVILGSYAAILFAYALPEDFQDTTPVYVVLTWAALMLRTFLFHLGLFLFSIALVAAIVRRWRLLIAALPLLVVSIGPTLGSYMPHRRPMAAGFEITVMTVNLLYTNKQTAAIIGEIGAARPDVLLLQEYTPGWHTAMQAALRDEYPHAAFVVRDDSFGLAVYSRTAFEEKADLDLPVGDGEVPEARVVVSLAGQHVAFYNIHLLPPRNLEYYTLQRREFTGLVKLLRHETLPIVLCGDLNFTNESAFADELRSLGLLDAHLICGQGRGATWPVLGLFRALPGIRLDHIFVSRELTAVRSQTGVGRGSDHRPVIAELRLLRGDE